MYPTTLDLLLDFKGECIKDSFHWAVWRLVACTSRQDAAYRRAEGTAALWRQIAVFAFNQQVNTNLLVKTAFTGADAYHIPAPTALLSDRVLTECRRQSEQAREDVVYDLGASARTAELYFNSFTRRGAEDPVKAWGQVIYTKEHQMGPLYRYCMACSGHFDDLAWACELPALGVYFWQRDLYDNVWKTWVPERLRTLADELAAKLREQYPVMADR